MPDMDLHGNERAEVDEKICIICDVLDFESVSNNKETSQVEGH